MSAGSAALGPPNLGREAPDPCGLLSSQPEQDLYLFLSSFVENMSHRKKLGLKKLSILTGVGAAGEFTVTGSAYLPSGSVTRVQFPWMLSALRCP